MKCTNQIDKGVEEDTERHGSADENSIDEYVEYGHGIYEWEEKRRKFFMRYEQIRFQIGNQSVF